MERCQIIEINVEKRIAIKEEEDVIQQRSATEQCSSGARWEFILHVSDADPVPTAVTKEIGDQTSEIPNR
jgi:hypothetical protein